MQTLIRNSILLDNHLSAVLSHEVDRGIFAKNTAVMESRAERYYGFLKAIVNLPSAPVVAVYLILIPASLMWKHVVPPLGLRKVLVVYNFLCSALSLCSVLYVARGYLEGGPKMFFSMEAHPLIKQAFFIYVGTKYLELLDTVFMILRHKQRQITFLHVYHHSSILLLSDYSYRFTPWPAISFMLGLNSVVHIFLYLYYGQAALYPDHKPTWRRSMTKLQITQFLVGLVHSTCGFLYHGFCVYSIFYGITMLTLFSNFYYQAFLRHKPGEKKSQ